LLPRIRLLSAFWVGPNTGEKEVVSKVDQGGEGKLRKRPKAGTTRSLDILGGS